MLDLRSLLGILWLNVDVGVGTRVFGPWIFPRIDFSWFFFFFSTMLQILWTFYLFLFGRMLFNTHQFASCRECPLILSLVCVFDWVASNLQHVMLSCELYPFRFCFSLYILLGALLALHFFNFTFSPCQTFLVCHWYAFASGKSCWIVESDSIISLFIINARLMY